MKEEEAQKERNETKSFLLPLYPKARQGRALREFGDVKLAARRVDDDGGRKSRSKLEVQEGNLCGDELHGSAPDQGQCVPRWARNNYSGILFNFSGPHPLYKPAKEKIVSPRDSLCQELQGDQNYCETCKQCDREIEYADRSSSMGVLARDDMHLITTNGGKGETRLCICVRI